MFESYYQVRDWLEGFIPQTYSKSNLGLERVKYLLKLLGNPQGKFKSIHVAGTSGKGSTAFYIARLLQFAGPVASFPPASARAKEKSTVNLQSSGSLRAVGNLSTRTTLKFDSSFILHPSSLKIGLHVSPHLVDIRERMQILESQSRKSAVESLMPMRKFLKLFGEIKLIVERIQREKLDLTPSYFEILVAASFLYFAREKVDWAVVEVGLGGRLDATNVLNPQLTVITNVGLDHTEILGTKVEKIAYEKAGIIKRVKEGKGGAPVITGASGEALKVIEKVAKEKNASLIKVNTQLGVQALKADVFSNINLSIDIFRSYSLGFAFSNKLLALAAVKTLGIPLGKVQIAKAFGSTFPGRFEEIDENVILDGAHNPQKIRFLIDFLGKSEVESRKWKVVLVVAFKKGKDWQKMVDLLINNLPVKRVIATEFYAVTDMGKQAAVNPKEIAKFVRSVHGLATTAYSNSHEAVFEAVNCQLSIVNCLILITGSLYSVGEARTVWHLPDF